MSLSSSYFLTTMTSILRHRKKIISWAFKLKIIVFHLFKYFSLVKIIFCQRENIQNIYFKCIGWDLWDKCTLSCLISSESRGIFFCSRPKIMSVKWNQVLKPLKSWWILFQINELMYWHPYKERKYLWNQSFFKAWRLL